MKLVLLKPYGLLPAGSEMDVNESVGEQLIRRKYARQSDEPALETKVVRAPAKALARSKK